MAPPPPADASRIGRRQMAGDSVAGLLSREAPCLVRNHARDNIRALREKERQLRGRKIMETQARAQPAQPFKLRQFENARSRLHDERPPRGGPAAEEAPDRRAYGAGGGGCAAAAGGDEPAGEEMGLADFEAEVERLKHQH